jgi:hypothetical protein
MPILKESCCFPLLVFLVAMLLQFLKFCLLQISVSFSVKRICKPAMQLKSQNVK